MQHKNQLPPLVFYLFIVLLMMACNNKRPFKPDYDNIAGVVIGKETCNSDPNKDYWLIDFNNSSKVGDTLVLNGITYTNVLKVKELDPKLKEIGMKVSIDYKTITPIKVITTACTIANPLTYPLKEIFIIYQFEIR